MLHTAMQDDVSILPAHALAEAPPPIELFTHIQPTWQRMFEDCGAARESIYFEQYILEDDDIGRAFLALFLRKAEEGLSVRLTFDYVGSYSIVSSDLVAAIRAAGGTVRFYNRITLEDVFHPSRWLPRNHCKTLVVDSRIAYVGSACIADSMKDWRDFHVRIAGITVPGLLPPDMAGDPGTPMDPVRYLVHNPRQKPNPIYQEFLEKITAARTRVYIATPYFFPPYALRRAMRDAAARGVNVTIMLSKKSDIPLLTFFTRSYFPWLINRGIRVVFYTESLLHAKYALVDDDWAMLGSTNVDYLSLRYNREGNLIFSGGDMVATLKGIFEKDLLLCEEADRDPGIFLRIFMPLVRILRKWM